MESSGELHALSTLTQEIDSQCPLDKRVSQPQSPSGCWGDRRIISCPSQESDHRRPSHCPWLYWPNYLGSSSLYTALGIILSILVYLRFVSGFSICNNNIVLRLWSIRMWRHAVFSRWVLIYQRKLLSQSSVRRFGSKFLKNLLPGYHTEGHHIQGGRPSSWCWLLWKPQISYKDILKSEVWCYWGMKVT